MNSEKCLKIKNWKLKVALIFCIFSFFIPTTSAHAWYSSNYGYCRKLTMTAGGTSGGVATTTTAGFTLWATSTISSLAASSSSGRIQKYNYASSTPTDVAFTNGTDCNSDGGTAIDFTWDSYASTTGAFAVAVEAGDISSTSAKTVLLYYGYSADTTHENDTGTFGALGEQAVWSFGTTTTNWTALGTWDRTANKNHGTLTSFPGASATVPGMVGSALNFDGTNDFVNVPDSASLDILTNFTFSVWVKATAVKSSDIIDTGGGACNGYALWLVSLTPHFIKQCDANSDATGGGALATNVWYHLVGTKLGSTATLYKNGVQVAQDTSFNDFANTAAKNIGKGQDGVFQGVLDDFRIYNRGLHAMDVLTIYNNTRSSAIFWTFGGEETEGPPENPPPVNRIGATTTISMTLSRPSNNIGLLGWWTFDGPDMVSNVRDRSGQGNHGNLAHAGNGTTTVPGKLGQALNFDAVDFWVPLGSRPSSVPFTVSAWIKPKTLSTGYYTAIYAESNIGLYISTSGDKIVWYNSSDFLTGNTTLKVAQWQHVVVTYDGSILTAYLDGVSDGTDTGSTQLPTSAETGIGGHLYLGSVIERFTGAIDDVRVYNRALSPGEVSTLYKTGTPVRISASRVGGDSLKSGLVGWWTFDGPDMIPNVRDKSGQADHGNLSGQAATTTAPGKVGQALSFDGINDFVSMGSSYNGVQSVSFWARVATSTTAQHILDLNGTQTVTLSSGTLSANSFTSPTVYVDGAVSSTLNDLEWHHVVITTGTGINATALNIGKVTNFFGGYLDDVRTYSRALSASEVLRLYSMGR